MNWTAITSADVSGSKDSGYIDTATGRGFDLDAAIDEVTARIRAACAAGNQLDQDDSKIPNSLKALGIRMVIRMAKNHIEADLTQDERDQRKEDSDYLKSISTDQVRFEVPDNPAGDAEMQPGPGMVDTAQPGNCGNSREELKGL